MQGNAEKSPLEVAKHEDPEGELREGSRGRGAVSSWGSCGMLTRGRRMAGGLADRVIPCQLFFPG